MAVHSQIWLPAFCFQFFNFFTIPHVSFMTHTSIQKLWNDWELRLIMVLSLSLQFFLMFAGPRRIYTKSKVLILSVGIAQSLGDWIAAYGIGLISSNSSSDAAVANELSAFWSPFLLLHLGGADIIARRSPDDVDSWLKLLVTFVAKCLAILFIFFKSFPNKIWVPTFLVFLAGICRSGQRVYALLFGGHEKLKDSRGRTDHAKRSETYVEMSRANMPTETSSLPPPPKAGRLDAILSQVPRDGEMPPGIVLEVALTLFDTFKGFISSKATFSSPQHVLSREFFCKRKAMEAFKLLELELWCVYQTLYTQAIGATDTKSYPLLNSYTANIFLVIASFVMYGKADKQGWHNFDVVLSYVLLSGALIQELISGVSLKESPSGLCTYSTSSATEVGFIINRFIDRLFDRFIDSSKFLFRDSFASFRYRLVRRDTLFSFSTIYTSSAPDVGFIGRLKALRSRLELNYLNRLIGRDKWSNSLFHLSLLDWCLADRSKMAIFADKLTSCLGLKDVLDILRLYRMVSVQPVTENVKEIIFDELRMISAVAGDKGAAIKICSQRGDWALLRSSFYKELKWSLGELEYSESLILWHVATEICFEENGGNDETERRRNFFKTLSDYMFWLVATEIRYEENGGDDETERRRKFCKTLSDYMFYLLVLRPDMMAPVAGDWETVFHDTSQHATSFFSTISVGNRKKACEELLSEYSNMPQNTSMGDGNKSVLAGAVVLAKQLQGLQTGRRWKLMSQVWVELMVYAACHCEADVHAQQPSQGGELLTFVWLLINHLGFGKQILEMEEDAPIDS